MSSDCHDAPVEKIEGSDDEYLCTKCKLPCHVITQTELLPED